MRFAGQADSRGYVRCIDVDDTGFLLGAWWYFVCFVLKACLLDVPQTTPGTCLRMEVGQS
jgi:hypothetical protein